MKYQVGLIRLMGDQSGITHFGVGGGILIDQSPKNKMISSKYTNIYRQKNSLEPFVVISLRLLLIYSFLIFIISTNNTTPKHLHLGLIEVTQHSTPLDILDITLVSYKKDPFNPISQRYTNSTTSDINPVFCLMIAPQ